MWSRLFDSGSRGWDRRGRGLDHRGCGLDHRRWGHSLAGLLSFLGGRFSRFTRGDGVGDAAWRMKILVGVWDPWASRGNFSGSLSAGGACREEHGGVGVCTAKVVCSENLVVRPFAIWGEMNGDANTMNLGVGLVGSKRRNEGWGVTVQSSLPTSFFALPRLRRKREISGLSFNNLGWGRDP